jgi:cytoskeleton protein RodZ
VVEQPGKGVDASNVVELPVGRGPGERLRAARTAAGLTLQGVADDLHLGVELLEALERDDYSRLPSRVFVRGYLRNYARLVDLPADAILAAFDGQAGGDQAAAPGLRTVVSARQIRSQVRSSHSAVRAVTWIIVLALGALLLTWWQGYLEWPGGPGGFGDAQNAAPVVILPAGETVSPSIQRDVAASLPEEKVAPAVAERPVAAATATPEPASPPAAEPPPVVAPVVALELTGRSWVEVLDSSGAVKINGTFEKGYRKTLEGQPPYRIAIGNYNAARLLVDGKPVDLLPHFNGRLVRLTLDPREPRPQP